MHFQWCGGSGCQGLGSKYYPTGVEILRPARRGSLDRHLFGIIIALKKDANSNSLNSKYYINLLICKQIRLWPKIEICFCKTDWSLVIQAVSAFGTVAVCILAIWADYFRNIFASAKLKIIFQNTDGHFIDNRKGSIELIYHLKVINERKWVLSKNTRVVLDSIYRMNQNGDFIITKLNLKTSFHWSPYPLLPNLINIVDQHEFDFGILYQEHKLFIPSVHFEPLGSNLRIGPNETVRYDLRIESENYYSEKPFIVEVTWNGMFSQDAQEMKRNITFKQIPN